MSTTPLPHQLNELANAYSDGLLNEHEYRILRQNLFERYASEATTPTETPVVPLDSRIRGSSVSSTSARRRPSTATSKPLITPPRTATASPNAFSPSPRSKASVTSGMLGFLRRATGRRSAPASPRDLPSINHSNPASKSYPASHFLKRTVLPRIISRKENTLSSPSSDSPPARLEPLSTPSRGVTSENKIPRHPTSTPTASTRRVIIPPSPIKCDIPSASINDAFDDENLQAVKDIRHGITALEAEGKRLVDAFNSLELSTLTRLQRLNARRLPVATPSHANLMEGRDWRDHGAFSTSTVFPDGKSQLVPKPDIDGSSIRSSTSVGTNLSRSKSVSFLRRPPKSVRPTTPQRPSLQRKKSMSSVSSQGTSLMSIGRLGISSSSSLSKSTGHLPLSILTTNEGMWPPNSAGLGLSEAGDAEMADIRRRREEVFRRYEARLEYLRARLKSAELHEKLMRK